MWDKDEDIDALVFKQAYKIQIDTILAGNKDDTDVEMHELKGDHAKRYSCFMYVINRSINYLRLEGVP